MPADDVPSASSTPTVARWELALRLKQRREERNLSIQDVADRLGVTRNYWSQVENERAVPTTEKLNEFAEYLELDDLLADGLRTVRELARARSSWDDYSGAHFNDPSLTNLMKRFYGLEAGATRINAYDSLIVNGLLQTEDYARAVIQSDPAVSPLVVESLVETRLKRQERLVTSGRVRLLSVMSQAALLQYPGGDGRVLRDQLIHLLDIAENNEAIEIRILPFHANAGAIAGAATLYLLEFSSDHLPDVAWQESITVVGFIDDPAFDHVRLSYQHAQSASNSHLQSLTIIAETADSLAAKL